MIWAGNIYDRGKRKGQMFGMKEMIPCSKDGSSTKSPARESARRKAGLSITAMNDNEKYKQQTTVGYM